MTRGMLSKRRRDGITRGMAVAASGFNCGATAKVRQGDAGGMNEIKGAICRNPGKVLHTVTAMRALSVERADRRVTENHVEQVEHALLIAVLRMVESPQRSAPCAQAAA